jgi:hypothetical protein
MPAKTSWRLDCVEVAAAQVSLAQMCRPMTVNAPSRISSGPCSLAKHVVPDALSLIDHQWPHPLGQAVCWVRRCKPTGGFFLGGGGVAARLMRPLLPGASRGFQMLPGAACQ